MLLIAGLSPVDIDFYGNTSLHQWCAGGAWSVLECFMMFGVYL